MYPFYSTSKIEDINVGGYDLCGERTLIMEVQKYSRSKGDDSDILAVPIFYKADIGDEGAIENIESLTEHKTGSQFMNFQEAITKATREECKALIFLNPDGVFDERVLSNAIPQFSVIAMI